MVVSWRVGWLEEDMALYVPSSRTRVVHTATVYTARTEEKKRAQFTLASCLLARETGRLDFDIALA